MPISIVIFVFIILIFAVRGYLQGSWRALTGIVGVLLGYWAGLMYTDAGAEWLQANSPVQGLMAMFVAGAAIFFAAVIMVRILAAILSFLARHLLSEDENVSLLSRGGGLLIGSVLGCAFALMAVYGYNIAAPELQNKLALDEDSGFELVETQPTAVTLFANTAAAFVMAQAMAIADVEPSVAAASAAAAAEPVKTAKSLQDLSNNTELKELFQDPEQNQLLAAGDLEAVIELPAFQALAQSDEMQQLAGVVGVESNLSQTEYQQQLADKMSRAAQKMNAMRNDPRMQEILNNPELQDQLNGGNPVELLNNPDLKELTEIFLSDQ